MTASIISLADMRRGPASTTLPERAPDGGPFETYTGCLMSTAYTLSGCLIAASDDTAAYLTQWVDDASLLSRIEAHPTQEKLFKFLLAYVLLEHARVQLWREIEDRLSEGTEKGG